MKEYKYLIVGGGVAGTTAAGTIRQHDPAGSIAIISDEPHYLYSRVMLSKPNFFLGKIPFDQIWLRDENWYQNKNINFIGGRTVTKLDHQDRLVHLDDNSGIKYEKLLLATGMSPRPLAVPGIEKRGVHYLRTLDQGKGIIESVSTVKRAVAVGGGFISFEMANIMHMSGAQVTIIIREDRFWAPILDATASQIVEQAIELSGVKLSRRAQVDQINGNINVTGITLHDGTIIPCDAVICGIGAYCNIDWVKESGIKIDRGILANQHLETNLPDVWTAGDVSQFSDPILEEEVQLGNWINAQEQGRIAGLNMLGNKTPFTFVSFYTSHGFDTSITFIGNVSPQKASVTITRHGPSDNQHAQIIMVDDQVVGAVLINQTPILQALSKIIASNLNITDKKSQLEDPNFDLNLLIDQ
ncbi:MAG: hypothetical protein A3G57_00250 [Candidatus Andersenbacteria bacterium RIFCSPLOWO2_12_FULL_45_8]|nr:MAG: NAD(P)H-nitrite reductase [Parcubacteria group bacterium GW2011_GWA2_45_14]OGY35447.1 MAG: hypothetical protein A3B76_01585 [Candidatus Andersenbacteria bacterium RIFCSPHIGHO2_02_FULL_46_16]OGY37650.1 MAG: hypothetical protein A3I08_05755 [Candidatus Andersenbacteria bacterium RIFCSPLOWO2_02_FULL_46_11]OGY41917.1 MAG: hypothetical protein A3G57_00250 [Candidatus Andersenbacteria bacterium RIFCSPLOWO2_12_FULL_45_8]